MPDASARSRPIFVKTYDLLLWLIPLTLKFPKSQRFLLAERLSGMALDFYDLILEAVHRAGACQRDGCTRPTGQTLDSHYHYLNLR